jgi:hypothetical protein
MKMTTLLILAFLLFVINVNAQNQSDSARKNDWKFGGSILIRSELDGRDFNNKTYPPSYTIMKTRVNVEKSIFDNVSLFVQLQDSRVWWQTANPTKSIANIDLHQGYVNITNIFGEPLSVLAGRFELEYGNGRILGTSQWNYVSRAWDGFKISYDKKLFSVDLFSLSYTALTDPTKYPYMSKPDTSFNIYGLHAAFNPDESNKMFVLCIFDNNDKKTDGIHNDEGLLTTNLNYDLNIGKFYAGIEGAYQTGRLYLNSKNKEASSYLGVIKFQYSFNAITASLEADVVSGTKPDDSLNNHTFYRPYGTAHQFYGYMDYFQNDISKSTNNLGLNDLNLKVKYAPKGSNFNAELLGWYFDTNQKSKSGNTFLGEEIDIVLRYFIIENTFVEWGGSIYFPGEVMKEVYVGQNHWDASFWSYVRLDVKF